MTPTTITPPVAKRREKKAFDVKRAGADAARAKRRIRRIRAEALAHLKTQLTDVFMAVAKLRDCESLIAELQQFERER